jgi:hypothetical protein
LQLLGEPESTDREEPVDEIAPLSSRNTIAVWTWEKNVSEPTPRDGAPARPLKPTVEIPRKPKDSLPNN